MNLWKGIRAGVLPDPAGNCHGFRGRSGLKESKQGMGMATGFQSRPRHEPVVRRRAPKPPLEPEEFFSCRETSTKMNLAQLSSSRIECDERLCLQEFARVPRLKFSIVTRTSSDAWIPELIAAAGPEVTETYIDFFTSAIRRPS